MTRTVLVVDDEDDISSSLVALLQMHMPDVHVETAASGHEALAALERGSVDLLISDFKMGGMNGVELLAAAREKAPATRQLLMTAFPVGQLDTRALPGVRVVQKPFNIAGMLATMDEALRE